MIGRHGGKQRVYFEGKVIVYLDSSGNVGGLAELLLMSKRKMS
jgi:hypothetical protein